MMDEVKKGDIGTWKYLDFPDARILEQEVEYKEVAAPSCPGA